MQAVTVGVQRPVAAQAALKPAQLSSVKAFRAVRAQCAVWEPREAPAGGPPSAALQRLRA